MGGARRAEPVSSAAVGVPAWAEAGSGRGAVAAACFQSPRLSSERVFLLLGYGGLPGGAPDLWLGLGWLQVPGGRGASSLWEAREAVWLPRGLSLAKQELDLPVRG